MCHLINKKNLTKFLQSGAVEPLKSFGHFYSFFFGGGHLKLMSWIPADPQSLSDVVSVCFTNRIEIDPINRPKAGSSNTYSGGGGRHRFWRATHDCVAPYVDIILHRGRF